MHQKYAVENIVIIIMRYNKGMSSNSKHNWYGIDVYTLIGFTNFFDDMFQISSHVVLINGPLTKYNFSFVDKKKMQNVFKEFRERMENFPNSYGSHIESVAI